ncbi:MAG: ABC transporter substrate-binding protein [Candidatus Rokubacteria bacterium]|nr:ABC transporter substrate-binding protein [Candidatus Rokubacteria bacterium]
MAGPEPVHPPTRAFLHTLRSLAYVEGQNLVFERRSAEGKFERFAEIVAELVRLKTDVIVTIGNTMTQAAKQVTTTVPIVMATSDSPIEAGLVASLARPGGNITGLTTNTGPEIEGKRLELLRDALPKISRVAYLGMKTDWEGPPGESVKAAAKALNVTLLHAEHTPNQYAGAFAVIARQRPDALFVGSSAPAYAHRRLITEFAVKNRLSGTYPFREFVEAGGLMSYGVSVSDLFRRAAGYVDKILKGANPADLPIEQPTKFELVINLKTAKSLGLTIPPSVLVRADEVIR